MHNGAFSLPQNSPVVKYISVSKLRTFLAGRSNPNSISTHQDFWFSLAAAFLVPLALFLLFGVMTANGVEFFTEPTLTNVKNFYQNLWDTLNANPAKTLIVVIVWILVSQCFSLYAYAVAKVHNESTKNKSNLTVVAISSFIGWPVFIAFKVIKMLILLAAIILSYNPIAYVLKAPYSLLDKVLEAEPNANSRTL